VSSASDPGIDESRRISRGFASASSRNDHGDIRHTAADVRETEVAVVVHVHLAAITHVDPGEMRDERDPSLREPRRGKIEPPRDDRSQAVGADDDRCRERTPLPAFVDSVDAGDPAVRVPTEVDDSNPLTNDGSNGPRPIEQQVVENGAPQREAAIPVTPKTLDVREPSLKAVPFGACTRMPARCAAPDRSICSSTPISSRMREA
jgi:hypothetical protein